jgi:lipopolysaccharide/colanic/teichoic acid biosynthesis glycosyltransferase
LARLISEDTTQASSDPVTATPATYAYARTKWVFDVSIALAALVVVILSAPFILVANLFLSPGPLIFKQTRVGQDGRRFTLYKFRSMNVVKPGIGSGSAESEESRISLVGRVLRKIHLDEFPQVWNVLKGEMSVVGPRPYIEEECSRLAAEVTGFESRHAVKPGITGLAQINYNHLNSGRDARKKLAIDCIYIRRCSLMLDILIITKTIWHAVTLRGV